MKTYCRKKNKKRILSLLTIIALLSVFVIPAFALTQNPAKEEVVYVNLNNDGSVDEIYVVNSFELNKQGQIVDYGNYTAFREMTASGGMQVDKEKITIDAEAGKLYYEGTLKSRAIPWSLSIQYFIDKKEYLAHRMAGKSGELEIRIKVRPASKKYNPFFDNFTLQASLMLDTSICKNIQAKDATIANAGKNKQLAFMVLPGREADFSITADVVDFEMDAMSINGLSMDMSLDFDEGAMFGSKLKELQDGVAELDDGAQELKDATKELAEGTGEFKDGVKDLDKAVAEMKDGTSEFVRGIRDLRKGTKDLDKGVGDLRAGTSGLQSGSGDMVTGVDGLIYGINELSGGLQLLTAQSPELVSGSAFMFQSMLDEASAQLTPPSGPAIVLTPTSYAITLDAIIGAMSTTDPAIVMLHTLKAQLDGYDGFHTGLIAYTDGVADASAGLTAILANIGGLRDGVIQLNGGVISLHGGVIDLKDGTSELVEGVIDLQDGIIELNDGVIELSEGIVTLLDGAVELHDGTVKLHDGTVTLAEGTLKFRDQTATIEKDMKTMIKDKIKELMGGNFDPISFVSEKNTNVTSVQFAMQTSSIKMPDVEKDNSGETPKLSIWQRLLALFGF